MAENGAAPLSAFAVYKQQQQQQQQQNKSSPKPKKRKQKEVTVTSVRKKKVPKPSVTSDDDEEIPQLVEIPVKMKPGPSANHVNNENKSKPKGVLKLNTEQNTKVKQSKKASKKTLKKKIKLKVSKVNGHKSSPEKPLDCLTESAKLFRWFINPIPPDVFFNEFWEKEAIFIERGAKNYYTHLLTTERLDRILRDNPLYYTRNIDVVSYENGVKENFNQEGRAVAAALWDYYSNGCSIRLLNPQTYDQKVHLLLATLQEYFGTMVGANTYLTPPGSQGFAPHYDDIEAFVVQLEGRKHWKLYKPQGADVLARDSSPNLDRDILGPPFMEVTLNAGDLLYFPRGTIHEGCTDPDSHSFHITVSVYQHTAYADLLEHVLPDALKRAAFEDVEFRKGLPLNYLKHVGCVNGAKDTPQRAEIVQNVKKLIASLSHYVDVDRAADKMGKNFMHDAMPPILTKQEVMFTSKGDGDYMKNGKVYNRVEIGLDTQVRLLRYYCLRVVNENDKVSKIYYSTDNAKVYHGEEAQWLEIDNELVPILEKMQSIYPEFIEVEQLPIKDDTAKVQLVADLWEKGLLVTKGPLAAFSGEEDSDYDVDEWHSDTIELEVT